MCVPVTREHFFWCRFFIPTQERPPPYAPNPDSPDKKNNWGSGTVASLLLYFKGFLKQEVVLMDSRMTLKYRTGDLSNGGLKDEWMIFGTLKREIKPSHPFYLSSFTVINIV